MHSSNLPQAKITRLKDLQFIRGQNGQGAGLAKNAVARALNTL
jgi:hypothetical protein